MSFLVERENWEREYWRSLLQSCAGNVSEAARRADVNRQGMYRLLRRLGLITEAPVRGRYGNAYHKPVEIHHVTR